jgi:hypothetical protein
MLPERDPVEFYVLDLRNLLTALELSMVFDNKSYVGVTFLIDL